MVLTSVSLQSPRADLAYEQTSTFMRNYNLSGVALLAVEEEVYPGLDVALVGGSFGTGFHFGLRFWRWYSV